jgi:hypothetical protein
MASLNLAAALNPYLVLPLVLILVGFTAYTKLFSRPALHPKAPPLTHGVYPLLGALKFFTRRWEFFRDAALASPTGNFSFFVGRKPVVGLTSENSRQVFFDNRHFGFAEGYGGLAEGFSVLFGPSAGASNAAKKLEQEIAAAAGDDEKKKQELRQEAQDKMDFSKFFNSRMIRVLRTDAMQRNLPKLIGDVRARLQDLAAVIPNKGFKDEAIVDPFDDIFKIAFQLTIRSVGCGDIADDLQLMGKMMHWYHLVDSLTSPTAVMYPWIPTWGMFKRTLAGMRLFEIVKKIGDERLRTGKRGEDAMQIMMDQGDDMGHIVGVSNSTLHGSQVMETRNMLTLMSQFLVCCIRPASRHHQFWRQRLLDSHIPLPQSEMDDQSPRRSSRGNPEKRHQYRSPSYHGRKASFRATRGLGSRFSNNRSVPQRMHSAHSDRSDFPAQYERS